MDRITIVAWHHLVNDNRFVPQPEIAKKIHKTPYSSVQGHWIRRQSRASVRLPISD